MKITNNSETSRVVKVAAVQISPVLFSREGTVEKEVNKIYEYCKVTFFASFYL